ncbi:coiled-coil domain-containing protein 87 [Peromyscus maniculatus bairdii]|uniref:Coiled-coil domain-containing protein 87 n=1 Tax=Peromyscus maniculatus bairdii TaxID=230844 RepID=A0A6I9LBL8_PERMB|nr:coiled-coil domain-containing protein 87 [Peromyscus maniculatus bairdii]
MEPQNQEPDLKPVYHRLLSPLSLFPRKATPPEPPKKLSQEGSTLQSVPLAKLKVGPLCRQVSKRLAGSGRAARVTPKDRLRLTQVILDELKCSWQEPPTEPILNYENNQKLRKRLESYVLICSEQLFIRYLHLLVTLPATRRVFTESATLSRLAANLARDCTIFLTSPDVYRCLLADFQTLLNLEQTQRGISKLRPPVCPPGTFKLCPIPWPHSTGLDQVPCSSLNLNYLVQLSRPYDFPSEPEPDPVKELKSIPELKGKKRLLWVPSAKKEKEVEVGSAQMVPLPSHSPPSSEISHFPTSPIYPRLLRGQSMPCLREGWSLADELGLPPLSPHPLTPLILAPESKPLPFGDLAAEDLKQKTKVMAMEWAHYSPLESGLPPLLGVLTRRLTAQQHIENLQQMLKSLEEEEASGQWDLRPPRIAPLHPQPVTITLKLQNQVVVQVATVQLSDRYFSDTFHVEGAGVLYNHLAGELDCKAIEEMDSDRLVGNSTKEVYKELMSRVSTSHLSFDEGPQIEPSADKDWSNYLSSAFIYQDKHTPVINHDLVGLYSKRSSIQLLCPEKTPSPTLLQKGRSWDKWPNKTVWMNWWKTAVSSEDYLKYLLTQETDFLHVIFQMYEEEASVEIPVPAKESLEIQHPPPLLEDEEPDFVPGKWDWSSVIEDSSGPAKAHILNLQQRLERLWVVLEVPDQSRLDMVIKYSSNARLQQLPALIRAWERVLKPIQTRELLLGRLEWFERQASDPNRFFQKPDLMLSRLLEENQIRSHIRRKLSLMETSLISLLEKIELVFGEPVTFKGRPYLEKMKQDKVEMLYWLQQQRRVRNLLRAQRAFQQPSILTRTRSRALIAPGNSPIAR